jgi:hypothetical protein
MIKSNPDPEQNREISDEKSDRVKWFDPILKLFQQEQERPEPTSEPTRLTRNELAIIQLVMVERIPWGISLEVLTELTEWILIGDEYPFHEYDEDFVSLSLGVLNAQLPPKKSEGSGQK